MANKICKFMQFIPREERAEGLSVTRLINLLCLGSQAVQIQAKNLFIYIAEVVRTVAWQQCNKASMTSNKRIVGTRVVLLHVSL